MSAATFGETLGLTLRTMREALIALPDVVADWSDNVVMRAHSPIDVFDDGSEIVCMRCKVPFPCDDYAKAAESLAERRSDTREHNA